MSGLQVKVPPGAWINEKTYAIRCVLDELLDPPIGSISIGQGPVWEIAYDGEKLIFPNVFFPEDRPEQYLTAGHLPAEPFRWVNYEALGIEKCCGTETAVPIFWYKNPIAGIEDIDIFGTVFFFLSRYEEYVTDVRDEINRFPAAASIAGKAKIIHRPIVDEYVWLLRHALGKKFPGMRLEESKYQFFLSHDVDVPHSGLSSKSWALTRTLILGGSIRKTADAVASYVIPRYDPVFCFDWMMSLSEKYGQRASFYFIVDGTADPLNISYGLETPVMRQLLRTIDVRGHEIGLHGSYNSYTDARMLADEKLKLESYVGKQVSGGRQHYLRFEVSATWRAWEAAGFSFDSTLGFAEIAGFRSGTAKEYPVFDLRASEALNLRERPLICMEHTLLHPDYQGLNMAQSYEYATNLIDKVRQFGGNFTLLWHNHNLTTGSQRELFSQIVKYAA